MLKDVSLTFWVLTSELINLVLITNALTSLTPQIVNNYAQKIKAHFIRATSWGMINVVKQVLFQEKYVQKKLK